MSGCGSKNNPQFRGGTGCGSGRCAGNGAGQKWADSAAMQRAFAMNAVATHSNAENGHGVKRVRFGNGDASGSASSVPVTNVPQTAPPSTPPGDAPGVKYVYGWDFIIAFKDDKGGTQVLKAWYGDGDNDNYFGFTFKFDQAMRFTLQKNNVQLPDCIVPSGDNARYTDCVQLVARDYPFQGGSSEDAFIRQGKSNGPLEAVRVSKAKPTTDKRLRFMFISNYDNYKSRDEICVPSMTWVLGGDDLDQWWTAGDVIQSNILNVTKKGGGKPPDNARRFSLIPFGPYTVCQNGNCFNADGAGVFDYNCDQITWGADKCALFPSCAPPPTTGYKCDDTNGCTPTDAPNPPYPDKDSCDKACRFDCIPASSAQQANGLPGANTKTMSGATNRTHGSSGMAGHYAANNGCACGPPKKTHASLQNTPATPVPINPTPSIPDTPGFMPIKPKKCPSSNKGWVIGLSVALGIMTLFAISLFLLLSRANTGFRKYTNDL